MQKSPFNVFILWIFKLKISEATGSNSPDKMSVEIFLSIKGFLVEVMCCMFDPSFLLPIDRKYWSETAPLNFL